MSHYLNCINLKHSAVFVALLHLVFIIYRIREIAIDIANNYIILIDPIAPIIVLIVIQCIVLLILLVGIVKEKPTHLIPWLIFVSNALIFSILKGRPTIYLATRDSLPVDFSSTVIIGTITLSWIIVLRYYIKLKKYDVTIKYGLL